MRGFRSRRRSAIADGQLSTDFGRLDDVNHELSFPSSFRPFLIGWPFSAALMRLFPRCSCSTGSNYNEKKGKQVMASYNICLLYTSPSPRD